MTPPKFAVGDRVRVVNRAGEIVIREAVVQRLRWEELAPIRSHATGDLGVVPDTWIYWISPCLNARPWTERALRPIPPEHPAIARKREAEIA